LSAVAYFDASALVKLVIDEPGSIELRAFTSASAGRATSIVGTLEARRGALRRGGSTVEHLAFVLDAFEVIELDQEIADAASTLEPRELRTLDAIHIASAAALGRDLAALVTYDRRMIDAAVWAGLPVVSPGMEVDP
jgi:predicted nucleic acid-binding protein